jgi:hypothetical protein
MDQEDAKEPVGGNNQAICPCFPLAKRANFFSLTFEELVGSIFAKTAVRISMTFKRGATELLPLLTYSALF